MKLFLPLSVCFYFLFVDSMVVQATPFNGYIVKLKGVAALNKQSSQLAPFGTIKEIINTSFGNFAHLETKQNLTKKALLALSKNPEIEYIEPNYIIKIKQNPHKVRLADVQLPTDNEFARQWGLYNEGSEQSDESSPLQGEDLNILKAWTITMGAKSEPIKIAVIDTGIDYKHPDLKNQMDVNLEEFKGKAGVDDDGNGFIDDIYGYDFANNDGDPMDGGGHGTHCAGVIGASHDGAGIVGVMANVKLVALKFLTDDGDGEEINAVRAIDYAIKRGVKVLSNSWGGTDRVQALEDAIIAANKAGLSFVAAAGNDATDNDSTDSFPSNYNVENIIAVGSFNSAGQRSDFSSYGIKSVHVMAPGTDIYSTYKGGEYEYLSGTSMSTPHVAGVIGLLLSQWPDLTPAQIRTHLLDTSKKTSSLADSSVSGGRVDAYKALSMKPNFETPN